MRISVRASQRKSKLFQKRKLHNSTRYLQDDESNDNSVDNNDSKKRKKSLTVTMKSIQSGGNRVSSNTDNITTSTSSSSVLLSDITSNESAAWKASQNEEGLKIERQRVRKTLHQQNIDMSTSDNVTNEDAETKNYHDRELLSDDDEHHEHLDYSINSDTESGSGSGSGTGTESGFGSGSGSGSGSARQCDDDFSDYEGLSPSDLEEGVGGDQGMFCPIVSSPILSCVQPLFVRFCCSESYL